MFRSRRRHNEAMKPRPGQDISKQNVATLNGGEVEPLSKLAAQQEDQRAENFGLEEEDKDLLAEVLASEDSRAT